MEANMSAQNSIPDVSEAHIVRKEHCIKRQEVALIFYFPYWVTLDKLAPPGVVSLIIKWETGLDSNQL